MPEIEVGNPLLELLIDTQEVEFQHALQLARKALGEVWESNLYRAKQHPHGPAWWVREAIAAIDALPSHSNGDNA